MEELYKNELQQLKDFAEREQYVSLSKILEVFQNPNEELLDDIIKYLENEGIEITRENEVVPEEEELLVEKVDDDFEVFADEVEIDEELEELTSVVEMEIKVADFEDFSGVFLITLLTFTSSTGCFSSLTVIIFSPKSPTNDE